MTDNKDNLDMDDLSTNLPAIAGRSRQHQQHCLKPLKPHFIAANSSSTNWPTMTSHRLLLKLAKHLTTASSRSTTTSLGLGAVQRSSKMWHSTESSNNDAEDYSADLMPEKLETIPQGVDPRRGWNFRGVHKVLRHQICSLLMTSIRTNVELEGEVGEPSFRHLVLRSVAHIIRLYSSSLITECESPDGDIIDCVLAHQQPAFDHPKLKGQKPMDPPERPKGGDYNTKEMEEGFQMWRQSGETCPNGTIPVRRTTEEDMLRASSFRRFGMKPRGVFRRDSTSTGHEHSVGYASGGQYYGAKASINVWPPRVANPYEFSLSQIWVISGSFSHDLNTIEAGWQVSPELYGDSHPRFFTYWTSDAYQTTGCYNLLCSGFVQTNHRIAIGAAISPISSYRGGQFDITLLIWKDPKHGNWWLELGNRVLVGYWPWYLFSHLRERGSMVQFGGEVVNSRQRGFHTSTQMGSGHFSGEGFRRASYFRNLQVVDWDNSLMPLSNLRVLADHPNCYDIKGGFNKVWGNYFYFGGPGRNVRCP